MPAACFFLYYLSEDVFTYRLNSGYKRLFCWTTCIDVNIVHFSDILTEVIYEGIEPMIWPVHFLECVEQGPGAAFPALASTTPSKLSRSRCGGRSIPYGQPNGLHPRGERRGNTAEFGKAFAPEDVVLADP